MKKLVLTIAACAALSALAADYKPVVCPGFYWQHLQGIAADSGKIYWSYSNKIIKTGTDGKIENIVDAPWHHGDCCFYGGKLYVAVNLGKFNTKDKADNYVYIYDADLNFIEKIALPEIAGGLGGITHHNGSFYAVGGIHESEPAFKICKYSKDFKLEKEYFVPVGDSLWGVQTICRANGRFWLGVYLQTDLKRETANKGARLWEMDDDFNVVKKHEVRGMPDVGIDEIKNSDGCNMLIVKRGYKKGKDYARQYAEAIPQKIEPSK